MTKLQLVSLCGLGIIAVLTLCQTATEAVYCSPSRDFNVEAVLRQAEEMRARREAILEAARRVTEEQKHAERRRRAMQEEWEAEREASRRQFREKLRDIQTQRQTTEKPAPERIVPEEKPAPERIVPEEKPAPERIIPAKPAPERIIPEKPAPERIVPEKPAPERIVPEKRAPERIVPEKRADPVAPEKIQTASSAEGTCGEVMREDRRFWKPAAESPFTLNTTRPTSTKHLAPNQPHAPLVFSQVHSEPFIQAQSCCN